MRYSRVQEHVDSPESRLDAGGIPVIKDGDIVSELLDETDLALCESGSARSDHIEDAQLVHREHIQIA